MQLHAFVRIDEAERFVKTFRVGSFFIRRQLEYVGTSFRGPLDGVLKQRRPDALSPVGRLDAYGFDLRPDAALIG